MVMFSCSREKNNFVSRSYHGTTTHFNGYFNAREGMKEAILSFEDGRAEDWEKPLPLIIYPSEQEATGLFPAMDKGIEKCSKVINRHSMLIKKKEYNQWIDDSYLLVGIANFYKRNFLEAEETFKFITKQYKTEEIRFEADLWLARLAIEQGKFTRAKSILEKLDESRSEWPKGMDQTYFEVYTHFYMLQGDYINAIEELKSAQEVTKKKDRQARQMFLLAQLYSLTGESQKAVRRYADVVKMNPDYDMKFYAQINQALAFDSRSDSEAIRAQLNKMLRDEKYVEFRDQIYYALAEVEFAERHVNEGIEMLHKSAESSVNNPKQKGKSFLRLAEIYFEERRYTVASSYYDSTITYLPTEFPDYEVIKATKESLGELVFHLNIVNHEDSVQAIASLDEVEMDKRLRQIIKEMRDAESERQRQEQEARLSEFEAKQNLNQIQADNRNGRGNNSGKWYFYNEASKSIGFAEFKAKYGQRSRTDNWRRKDKTQIIEIPVDGQKGDSTLTAASNASKIPTIEELKAGLPLTEGAVKLSNDTIANSLFEIGKIYKDNLGDVDNAIETFEEMNARLPENKFEQMAFYQLYRLYLKKEESGNYFPSDARSTSAYYKSLITEDFPESEFARLINDPDYMANHEQKRIEEMEAYEGIFRLYRQRNYTDVLVACLDVMNNEPNNRYFAKYHLLRAMAIAGKKDRANFISALQEIVRKFPGTEEEVEAKRLLGILQETASEEEKDSTLTDAEEVEAEEEKPKGDYVMKEDMDHYFAILIPNKGSTMSEYKVNVSDFNAEYYRSEPLKVTNSFIDADSQILLVRTFDNKEKGMAYLNAFLNEKEILSQINEGKYETFIITSKNFATLFKSKDIDGYIEFFDTNYKQ